MIVDPVDYRDSVFEFCPTCWKALRQGKQPKASIANGRNAAELPDHLRVRRPNNDSHTKVVSFFN